MTGFVDLLRQIPDQGHAACRNCRFWWRPEASRLPEGACRLYPPGSGGGRRTTDYPRTCLDAWCGQHEPEKRT